MKTTSKNFWVLGLAASLMLLSPNADASSAIASQIQGEVLVQKAGTANWAAVTQDTALASGDSVQTKQGSCSLVYSDQATFAVEPNTTLTVEERADANDIKLLLGKIKGKVDKQNVEQPFVVTTPAAVATVRGTDVDFSFNENGELIVDLHNGNIQVLNEDAEMLVELEGKKSITVKYDKMANVIRIKNECGSDGQVKFNILGAEYSESPCSEREFSLATAAIETEIPGTTPDGPEGEQPDEGRRATDTII
jgi:hypothetical protein